jgi:hypothetical protein
VPPEISELSVLDPSGGVEIVEERGVALVAVIHDDPELVAERDLMLTRPVFFIILALNEDIFTSDRKSSSEPSRIEAHLRSQLRLGGRRRMVRCAKVDWIRWVRRRAILASPLRC